MRILLQNRQFSLVFMVSMLSVLGVEMARLALPLIVYEIQRSEMELSVLRGVVFLPNIVLAIFIGTINDRVRRVFALRFYLAAQAAILLCTAWALKDVAGGLGLVLTLVFFLMAFFYASGNVQTGLVQQAVPVSDLVTANALLSGFNSTISVFAPMAAGALLVLIGGSGTIVACAIALFAAMLFSALIRLEDSPKPKGNFLQDITDGLKAFASNRELVVMSLVVMIVNGAEGIYATMLIVLLKSNLGVGDFEVGVVLGLTGVGAVCGAWLTPYGRRAFGVAKTFAMPIVLVAGVYVGTAFSPNVAVVAALGFLEGLISTVFVVSLWTFRQETVERRYIGRVAGISGAIFKIGMPPLIILGGLVSTRYGVVYCLLFAALLNVLVFAALVPTRLWRYKSPVDGNPLPAG
ncbi:MULTISPECIES: MFS transporter [unclassified Mesorhizobium]|uniref:MFS transporter n=1 Tax=unclassified Mesorhizobium TaxID=325217 RepID=UPI0009EC68E7|nr:MULTISPECIES: MFS transporter [unclassified Mesorhizobium]